MESVVAFQIAPTRQTIVLDPGTSQIIPLAVFNDSSAQQIFTPELSAFLVDSKTGSPIFDQPDEATAWFRVLPERLLLQPGQSGTFSFTISVPNSAEPKSHYLGLFAKTRPANGQIGVSTRLGSLLFLHIGGEVREELVRKTFQTELFITKDGNNTVQLQLENVGTIHVVPEGTIALRDRSGAEIAAFPLNPEERKVLPGGVFDAEYSLNELGTEHVGPVQVSMEMQYGVSQKELHDRTMFWYLPDIVIFFCVAGVIILLFVFFFGAKKMRGKKKKTKRNAKR